MKFLLNCMKVCYIFIVTIVCGSTIVTGKIGMQHSKDEIVSYNENNLLLNSSITTTTVTTTTTSTTRNLQMYCSNAPRCERRGVDGRFMFRKFWIYCLELCQQPQFQETRAGFGWKCGTCDNPK